MSKSKTAIAEIKKLMVQFGFMSDEPVMASFKLEDNTILQTAKLEAGESIVKINDLFEQVPLETGKFRLVENFEIEVLDGKIKSVKQIFLDATMKDGTQVKVSGDALAEGAKVTVVQGDAEVPAPDGDWELQDGTKITTKDGNIVSVQEVPGDVETGETPEAPGLEIPSSTGDGESAPEGEVPAPVEDEPMDNELLSLLKDFISKVSDKINSMEIEMASVKNEFEAFKKEPSAKKIANGKTDFNKQPNSDGVDARLSAIMALRNKK